MCGRWSCWSLLLGGPLTAAALVAPASAEPQLEGSPIRMLLEKVAGRLLWIYDGIRHVELPLAEGRAVIGLSCERQTWNLFRIERNGKDVYSYRNDPSWGYQPAGPMASSRLCTDAIRVAE